MSLITVPKKLRADAIREIEDWAKRPGATFASAEVLTICEELRACEQRIARAKEILPDVDNDIVREALWNALEGK